MYVMYGCKDGSLYVCMCRGRGDWQDAQSVQRSRVNACPPLFVRRVPTPATCHVGCRRSEATLQGLFPLVSREDMLSARTA